MGIQLSINQFNRKISLFELRNENVDLRIKTTLRS